MNYLRHYLQHTLLHYKDDFITLHFISTHFNNNNDNNNNNLLLSYNYRFINLLPVLFFSLVWDHCIQCVPIATIHVFLL